MAPARTRPPQIAAGHGLGSSDSGAQRFPWKFSDSKGLDDFRVSEISVLGRVLQHLDEPVVVCLKRVELYLQGAAALPGAVQVLHCLFHVGDLPQANQ